MTVTTVSPFERLCDLEPRLADLRRTAAEADDPLAESFCGDAFWFGWDSAPAFGLKARVSALVGWERGEPGSGELFTAEAFDDACRAIYAALPECRNCRRCAEAAK